MSECRLYGGSLLGLGVDRVLPAEGAVLVELQTVSGVLFVFLGVVVALLALVAPQGDLHPVASFCHMFRHLLITCRANKKEPVPADWPAQPEKAPGRGLIRGGVRPA